MTGSEEKVLTDFSNLSSSQQQKDTKRLPELRHNINLITNLAKTDLTYLAKQLSLEEDCQIRRKDDIEKTVELIQRDKEELGLVQDYLSISKSIATLLKTHSDDISNPSIPPETCYIHFKPQIESLPETHHLQSLKYNLFTRLIQPRVQGWSALETPAYFSTILLQAHKSLGDLTPWLIYSQILPPIRSVILTYDIHNPEGLITLLEIYKPYCDWVWKNITNLILPRLQVIIEEYDFKRDWRIQYCLIPFMNVIGVETLMSRVRERLSVHVQNTPLLAREVYEYWKEVWDESDLDKFVERGVLPTLIEFMQREVQVDPSNQDLQPLEKVLEWHGRIKDHLLSNLLVTEFFSKWNQVLKLWISNSLVDLDEISGWYTAWKGFFDQKGVSYLLGVKEAFKNGLDLINQGLSGNLRGISKIKVKSRVSKVVKTLNTAQMSFKELVELECGERSIEFVPLQKRNVEGKEVYRMGKLKVYIDDGVLFVNVGGEYKYMGIEEAMSKATE